MISVTESGAFACWTAMALIVVSVAGCGVDKCGADAKCVEQPPPSTPVEVPPVTATAASASPAPATDAPAAAAPADGALASVAWLVGSWVGKNGEGADVEETWSAPAGKVMSGTGRTKKGDKETKETLRIEARDGGAVVYVAQPGTAPPTEFPLDAKTSGPTHAQFVNEAHDWPTRIRYERVGDELKVRVRGRPGQADEQWTMKKK